MSRAFISSLVAAALMMSGLVGGVYALFTDTETAESNFITTGGSPDLRLTDDDEINSNSVIATWVMNEMAPGVTTLSATVNVKNAGTTATTLGISVVNIMTDPTAEESDTLAGADNMDKFIQITKLEWSSGDFKNLLFDGTDDPNTDQDDVANTPWNELDDVNGNGWVDLDDFERNPITFLLPIPTGVQSLPLTMDLLYRSEAGDDFQGDVVTMTMTIILED